MNVLKENNLTELSTNNLQVISNLKKLSWINPTEFL